MSSPFEWISPSFEAKEGTFTISGVPIADIAAKIAPPFYVYDAATIRRQYEQLAAALAPHGVGIYYSVKPNSALAVVDELRRLGGGLEIGSMGELEIAKNLQADPKRISFAGPVKTAQELHEAIAYGVDKINVESEAEIFRLNDIAGHLGKKQRIGIRVNPPKKTAGAEALHMGGGPQKFGIDLELLTEDFIKRIQKLPHVSLEGLHVYAANQIADDRTLLANIRMICEIAKQLRHIFPVRFISFGGGFDVPYKQGDPEISLSGVSEGLGQVLADFPFLTQSQTELFVEPGRYLVAQSGIYAANVDHTKASRGTAFVMIDGGWHQIMRSAPRMGFDAHPIYNLSRPSAAATYKYDVAGSLCTPIDVLGTDIPLPVTEAGDLMGVFVAGAYGRSQSPLEFLSHATPAEVLVDDGSFHLIRPARQPAEFLRDQHMRRQP